MFRLIVLGVIALIGWLSYQRFYAPKAAVEAPPTNAEERVIRPPSIQRDATPPASSPVPAVSAAPTQGFKCDGRIYCSQMTSCAEAKFFLKNCPGTQMDGDNDGVPCERQWCR